MKEDGHLSTAIGTGTPQASCARLLGILVGKRKASGCFNTGSEHQDLTMRWIPAVYEDVLAEK